MRTTSTYSRVRASGASKGTPCHPSETCGPDTPSPSRNRPPDNTSSVAAVIAVIAGDPGWDSQDRAAHVDVAGVGSDPGEDADRVRPVGLGCPHHRVPQPFGLLGQPYLVAFTTRAQSPVGQVQA